jgi:DNA-binding response OmpR family regulator
MSSVAESLEEFWRPRRTPSRRAVSASWESRNRPSDGAPGPVRRFGDLAIDHDARQVSVGNELLSLTKIEFELLAALCSKPGVVFSRSELLDLVWGSRLYSPRLVDTHLSNLRKKLEDRNPHTRYLHTVRGIGFRLNFSVNPP